MRLSILDVCVRDFFILVKSCDVANFLTLTACHFFMPSLWFPCLRFWLPFVIIKISTVEIMDHTGTVVTPFPLGKVVLGFHDDLGPFIAVCQLCILETSDHATITIRVRYKDHCCTKGIVPHFLGYFCHFSRYHGLCHVTTLLVLISGNLKSKSES
jgi:hypothetical protein